MNIAEYPVGDLCGSCSDKNLVFQGREAEGKKQRRKEAGRKEICVCVCVCGGRWEGWMSLKMRNKLEEFPLWLSRLRTQHSVCEEVGLIPGLA